MYISNDDLKLIAQRNIEQRLLHLSTVEFGEGFTEEFSLREIREATNSSYLNYRFPFKHGTVAIYTIAADNNDTIHAISNAFPRGLIPRSYCLPRINNHQDSLTIYVGSSERVQSRLKEHLWRAASQTYALHFSRWCPDTTGSVVVRVQPIIKPVARQVRQDLEDALWQRLRPIYGKSGGR